MLYNYCCDIFRYDMKSYTNHYITMYNIAWQLNIVFTNSIS